MPDPNSLHAVPPPEPAAEKASGPTVITTPDDLPGAPVAIAPRATRGGLRTAGSGATSDTALDPARASATMAAVPQPPPPPPVTPSTKSARSIDKSEVF